MRNLWPARLSLIVAIVVTSLIRADALPGIIDPNFGFDGRMLSPFMGEGTAFAIDHNGQMVMAGTQQVNGHSQIVVARFNAPDAISLDITFGNFGVAIGNFGDGTVDNVAVAVAIDPANRVIVAGYTNFGEGDKDFLIARFTAQGKRDVTFNPTGTFGWRSYGFGAEDKARAMAIDSLGRIVVAGARFGDQDNSCGPLPGLCTPGEDIAVLRVLPNGDPDPSFDGDGRETADFHDLDEVTAVAIDQQDRIVVVGASLEEDHGAQVEAMRFKTNGGLDNSFDGNGSVSFRFAGKHYSAAAAVAIDRFGGIVIGGVVAEKTVGGGFHPLEQNFDLTADFALTRLKDDGSRDRTFGNDGFATFVDVNGFDDIPRAMVIDAAGRIILAGSATFQATHEDFALVRYTGDGLVDSHYGINGIATTDFPYPAGSGIDQVRGLALDSEGRAVAAGVSTPALGTSFFALARFQVEQPDFRVSPMDRMSFNVGRSGSTTVTVNSIDGLSSLIKLHVAAQPDGAGPTPGFTASFDGFGNQAELTPPPDGSASVGLTMSAGVTVTPGTYTFFLVPDPDTSDHRHAVPFSIGVTTSADAATTVVTAFEGAGAIDNHSIATALTAKLAQAQAASDADDVQSAGNTLSAFISQVKAQTGKHIAASATINGVTIVPADVLIEHAQDLIVQLKTHDVPNPVIGYVTTSTNEEIPDAIVSVFDPTTNAAVATATTDAAGFYYFANTNVLTPGVQYTVKVTGFPKGFTRSTPKSHVLHWLTSAVTLPTFVLTP